MATKDEIPGAEGADQAADPETSEIPDQASSAREVLTGSGSIDLDADERAALANLKPTPAPEPAAESPDVGADQGVRPPSEPPVPEDDLAGGSVDEPEETHVEEPAPAAAPEPAPAAAPAAEPAPPTAVGVPAMAAAPPAPHTDELPPRPGIRLIGPNGQRVDALFDEIGAGAVTDDQKQWLYKARRGNEWFVVHGKTKLGPYSKVWNLKVREGKPYFYFRRGEQDFIMIMYNGQEQGISSLALPAPPAPRSLDEGGATARPVAPDRPSAAFALEPLVARCQPGAPASSNADSFVFAPAAPPAPSSGKKGKSKRVTPKQARAFITALMSVCAVVAAVSIFFWFWNPSQGQPTSQQAAVPERTAVVVTALAVPTAKVAPKYEREEMDVSPASLSLVAKASKGTKWEAAGDAECFQIDLDAWSDASLEKVPAVVDCTKSQQSQIKGERNGKPCWVVTDCKVVRRKGWTP